MDLRIDGIEVEDFKEFRGEQWIDLDALGLGVHFMQGLNKVDKRLGSNGAGKSSLWDALCWAFYGFTVAGLRGPDVKNWYDPQHSRVEVIFRIDDVEHSIERSTKTNGLTLDGKLATQQEIDRLLNMSHLVFTNTILFGQGQALFFDMQPRAKMQLLSDALDLDKWERRSKLASEEAGNIGAVLTRLDFSRASEKSNLNKAHENLEDLKRKMREYEQQRSQVAQEREKQIRIIEKALERAEQDFGTHDLAYDGAETELRASQKALDKARDDHAKTSIALGRLSAEAVVLQKARRDAQDALSALEVGDKCPTCGQSLKGSSIAKHRKEAQATYDDARRSHKKIEKLLEAAGAAHVKTEKAVERLQKEVRTFRDKSNDAIDARGRAESRVQELKAGLKQAKQQTSANDDKVNPYSELVAKERKAIKDAKAEIEAIEKKIRIKEKKKARAEYWVKGFKHVRLYLIEEVLAELEAVTNSNLPSIGLDGWAVKYAMERETKQGNTSIGLNVSILKPGLDRAVRWESWSLGEAQRLRLLGALALRDVLLRRQNITCPLLVLDEPTRHMSKEGIAEMCEYLIEVGRDQQVFYVDHAANSSVRFASTITVTKTRKAGAIITY